MFLHPPLHCRLNSSQRNGRRPHWHIVTMNDPLWEKAWLIVVDFDKPRTRSVFENPVSKVCSLKLVVIATKKVHFFSHISQCQLWVRPLFTSIHTFTFSTAAGRLHVGGWKEPSSSSRTYELWLLNNCARFKHAFQGEQLNFNTHTLSLSLSLSGGQAFFY